MGAEATCFYVIRLFPEQGEMEKNTGVKPKHRSITKTETNRSAIITKLGSNPTAPSEHEFVSAITIENNKGTLTTINTYAPQSDGF